MFGFTLSNFLPDDLATLENLIDKRKKKKKIKQPERDPKKGRPERSPKKAK